MSALNDDVSQASQSQAGRTSSDDPGDPAQVSRSQLAFPVEVLPFPVFLFVMEISASLDLDPASSLRLALPPSLASSETAEPSWSSRDGRGPRTCQKGVFTASAAIL